MCAAWNLGEQQQSGGALCAGECSCFCAPTFVQWSWLGCFAALFPRAGSRRRSSCAGGCTASYVHCSALGAALWSGCFCCSFIVQAAGRRSCVCRGCSIFCALFFFSSLRLGVSAALSLSKQGAGRWSCVCKASGSSLVPGSLRCWSTWDRRAGPALVRLPANPHMQLSHQNATKAMK